MNYATQAIAAAKAAYIESLATALNQALHNSRAEAEVGGYEEAAQFSAEARRIIGALYECGAHDAAKKAWADYQYTRRMLAGMGVDPMEYKY